MSYLSEIQSAWKEKRGWKKLTRSERFEARWGYAFIGIWLIGFTIFYFIPMIASLIFSFFDFQLATPEESRFIGLGNWRRLLFQDPLIWQSLGVTFRFALISLPFSFFYALFVAILLNSKHLLGVRIFRTLFYAPSLVPAVAAVFIWQGVLDPTTGWINLLIEWVTGYDAASPEGLRWLSDPKLIYISYTLVGLWSIGNAIIFNLASLQGVPTELYEAARIDGASWWRQLWSITLPMISPIIFYNLLLGIIGLLQYFTTPWVLNGGNGFPENSTYFYMIHFFKQAFTFQNMGYGATIAWFMFLIALTITLILFGTARYWVYYAGERR